MQRWVSEHTIPTIPPLPGSLGPGDSPRNIVERLLSCHLRVVPLLILKRFIVTEMGQALVSDLFKFSASNFLA